MDADQPELRLSDAERENAIEVLGEHVSTGRLDLDEYADRSAKVAAARTRGDLVELFADLPEPLPKVLVPSTPLPASPAPRAVGGQPPRSPAAWLASSAVPIAAALAIVLFFTMRVGPLVFLLPLAAAILIGGVYGRGRQGG